MACCPILLVIFKSALSRINIPLLLRMSYYASNSDTSMVLTTVKFKEYFKRNILSCINTPNILGFFCTRSYITQHKNTCLACYGTYYNFAHDLRHNQRCEFVLFGVAPQQTFDINKTMGRSYFCCSLYVNLQPAFFVPFPREWQGK